MTRNNESKRLWFLSLSAFLILWVPIALVTFFHYFTSATHHWLHDVFRRLYYIPIVLGAFRFGLKGSLSASVIASIVYTPHAFSHYFEHDPGATIEKMLEILLYNIVAFITGFLARKEKKERLRQETIAQKLKQAVEEKKLLEKQLIRAGKLKALGELTAGIAHELKNPIASIQGAAEAISDEIAEDSPRRNLVMIQKKELKRLSETLDRFLSFARPGNLMRRRMDLVSLIEQVAGFMNAQTQKQGIELVVQCKQEAAEMEGDRDQLMQVFVNLVLNAMDVMPEGGRIQISLRQETLGNSHFFVTDIADTGPGIPDEMRDRIFDFFYSTKANGTGLGLAISTNIVDGHAGFIRVNDGPNRVGSTFSVYLPSVLF
jgi:signal transduction histidine kinase